MQLSAHFIFTLRNHLIKLVRRYFPRLKELSAQFHRSRERPRKYSEEDDEDDDLCTEKVFQLDAGSWLGVLVEDGVRSIES